MAVGAGISMLLCVLSVVLTVLLSGMMHFSQTTIVTEVVIWGGLGYAMFRGHRWAFVVGMILWTLEKGTMFVTGASAGQAPIGQIFFWAIYMGAFMHGFRVERARKRKTNIAVAQAG